jgi:hypothetical protein
MVVYLCCLIGAAYIRGSVTNVPWYAGSCLPNKYPTEDVMCQITISRDISAILGCLYAARSLKPEASLSSKRGGMIRTEVRLLSPSFEDHDIDHPVLVIVGLPA